MFSAGNRRSSSNKESRRRSSISKAVWSAESWGNGSADAEGSNVQRTFKSQSPKQMQRDAGSDCRPSASDGGELRENRTHADSILCPVCGAAVVHEKCKLICRSEVCRGRVVMNCSEF